MIATGQHFAIFDTNKAERERERERERDEIDRRSICGKDIVRCKTFNKIYKEIERGRFIFNFYKHVK